MEQINVLPRDEEAERIVLGTIMTDRKALDEVREILTTDSFYVNFHAAIYKAILEVDGRGERPDIISVKDQLGRDKVEFDLMDFMSIASCQSFDVYQHAAIIHDKEKRRKFYEIGNYLISNCYNEENDIVDVLQDVKDKLDGVLVETSADVSTLRDALQGVYEQINRTLQGGVAMTGSPTGLSEYDNRTGGLQTSDLIIVAADTSQGKSSLAIKFAMSAGCPVAFYSMEMTKQQIAARMLSAESGISSKDIQMSRLSEPMLEQIDRGVAKVLRNDVYFDDRSTSNIDTILSSIRALKIKYGIKGAIVDYLQILNVNMKGANKEQQMGDVARRLKNIAKELDIWVVALSQLNRDNLSPVPTLARLRDSGQIAEAADVVMLIYRPEYYNKDYPEPFKHASTQGTAMIDVAKGRNVGTFKFLVGFNKPTTSFYNLSDIPPAPVEEEPF